MTEYKYGKCNTSLNNNQILSLTIYAYTCYTEVDFFIF